MGATQDGSVVSRRWPAACAAVALALAVAFFAVWFGAVNQDEGWYLYAARLVRDGKVPYRDFFFTQGPALPFVYALTCGLWADGSVHGNVLGGLLGGRLVTVFFSLLTTGLAVLLVRRMVRPEVRAAAGAVVFALLSCNVYHVYFTAIPKTYALGGALLVGGLALVAHAVSAAGARRLAELCAAGLLVAFASGTRISLVLALPVVALALLVRNVRCPTDWKAYRFGDFTCFCIGGFLGLGLVYGFFAADPAARAGLLMAQAYHAGRGGFDPLFAAGSVSRWARGYAAAGILLLATPCLRGGKGADADHDLPAASAWLVKTCVAVFAAVFLLQLSAPFPYDDYQVPLMPVLCAAIAALFANRAAASGGMSPAGVAWFALLAAGLCSFASPLLQEWSVAGQDRFWSVKKEQTELAQMRRVAREMEKADPGGGTLLTQDLYLAVELGRTVPEGFEMGPFSYFGDLPTAEAEARHVMNPERMEKVLATSSCPLAAFSGYGFAVSVPRCGEVPAATQARHRATLAAKYEPAFSEPRFGQNATALTVYRLKR